MTKEQMDANRKAIHELMDIALDTNGFEDRAADKTGTLPTVFTSFFGHVSKIKFEIYTDGWGHDGHSKTWEINIDEPINHDVIDAIRAYSQYSLTDKKESEVLQRSIEAQAGVIQSEKDKLKELRKSLRKAQKREERQAATV